MTSKRATSSGMTGSQQRQVAVKPCTRTRGSPDPARYSAGVLSPMAERIRAELPPEPRPPRDTLRGSRYSERRSDRELATPRDSRPFRVFVSLRDAIAHPPVRLRDLPARRGRLARVRAHA